MLTDLHIKNFAIIDELNLQFGKGLIIFTGETGAGKSIILDAVEVLLGGRMDTSFIRSGTDMAIIEGWFHISDEIQQIQKILEREDLLDKTDELSLSREIRINGRSVARINGRSVSVGILRELGECLIDLHGQSEHLSLLRTQELLDLLDRYSNAEEQRQAYQKTYHELRNTRKQIAQLRQIKQDAARKEDLLRYQLEEIEAAHLKTEEESVLRSERNRLANAEALALIVQESLQVLEESLQEAPSAVDLIGQAVHNLGKLQRMDSSQTGLYEQATALLESIGDLTRKLRDYIEAIEFNPKRLDQVEERLDLILKLEHKYGDSITKILEYAERTRQEFEAIVHVEENEAALEKIQHQLFEEIQSKGHILSETRKAAAQRMSDAIQTELNDLRMNGAQFKVDFQPFSNSEASVLSGFEKNTINENGLEKVEFLIAPNPGEGLKPLVKIASGGETSRLMLALKNVLVQADNIPTLIFDEIDQGIGGRVGVVVGKKLWQLARKHQVFCITHLPQLAAYGDQHFQVRKNSQDERTTTMLTELRGEDRILELAQMLGEVSDGTLRSAFELLQSANTSTQSQ